jgi:hypothetical protein
VRCEKLNVALRLTSRRCDANFARVLFAPVLAVAVLVATPSRAEGVPVADATSAQKKSAERKLSEGQKLFKAGKFDEAIAAFAAAHEIVATPEARLMMARSYQNSGELLKARDEYMAAIAEARAAVQQNEKYRQTLQSAQRELTDLEGVLGKVTIKLRHAPAGTTVSIDGEAIDASKLADPIVLPPGQIRISAQTPDGRETDRQLSLSAGQDAKVDLAFPNEGADESPSIVEEGVETPPEPSAEPPAAPGNGRKTAAFIAGGVGVAGLAVFGVFGLLSNSKYKQLQDACQGDRCAPSRQSDIDAGKRDQTLANVGLVVGAVGLGTSAALFLFGGSGHAEKAPKTARVELGIGFGTVQLSGRFE